MMNIHNVCGEKYSIYIERNSHEKLITYKTNKKLADVMQIREKKEQTGIFQRRTGSTSKDLISICTVDSTWDIFA